MVADASEDVLEVGEGLDVHGAAGLHEAEDDSGGVAPPLATGERGGRAAALYLGLIQSCKVNDVNPWAYFDDILRRIMPHPAGKLRELLPDQWKPAPHDANGQPLP